MPDQLDLVILLHLDYVGLAVASSSEAAVLP